MFYQAFTPFFYAAPACFYLYVSHFVSGKTQLKKIEWLHFLPAFVALIHALPWSLDVAIDWKAIAKEILENKILFISEKTGWLPAYFQYICRPALLLGYLIASWYVVLTSKSLKERTDPGRNWIFFFLRIASFFQLAGFLPLLMWNMQAPIVNATFVVLNCLALLFILVFILHRPSLFYGYLFVAVNWNREVGEVKTDSVKDAIKPVSSATKITLLPEQLSEYPKSMTEFMELKKPYLKKDFQIIDLAGELELSVHHCSFVVNNVIGKNFRDWINGYRIEYFLTHYPLKSGRMTIEAIAHESGFKSLATFYNAFKKETGLMPTTYFSQKNDSEVLQLLNS